MTPLAAEEKTNRGSSSSSLNLGQRSERCQVCVRVRTCVFVFNRGNAAQHEPPARENPSHDIVFFSVIFTVTLVAALRDDRVTGNRPADDDDAGRVLLWYPNGS